MLFLRISAYIISVFQIKVNIFITDMHNDYEVIVMQFKNLRGIREDRDIKQKDIAAYLNVSQNTYSQYETGVISLTADVLIKLSDYYNVSIDYLLDRTNNPVIQKKP